MALLPIKQDENILREAIMELTEIADAIIDFETKHNVSDNDLAFASHLSVEKVHAMKSGNGSYSDEEAAQLLDYMTTNL